MTSRPSQPFAPILRGICFAQEVLNQFNAKNSWVLASHIAMSMMLALFPFVLFTVALSGALAGLFSERMDINELVDLVFSAWPETVATPIKKEVYAVLASSGGGLITLGAAFALYFASNGVDAVRVGMIAAYGQKETRPFWQRKLLCLGLVVLGGAGVMLVAVFELALPLASLMIDMFLPEVLVLEGWEHGLNGIVAALLPVAAILIYHLALPLGWMTLRDVLPGVALTVIAWWGLAAGFAIYITHFASYSATYAGLASAMAALIFLYLNAALLLLGAEVNGALIKRRAS